jgi:hypothetical protein
MKRLHHHLLAASLLAGLGFSAFAQTQPPSAAAPAAQQSAHRGGHHAMDPARLQQRQARMQKRMQEQLDYFKFKLKITPAQEGAWSAWTAAIQPAPRPLQRLDRAEFRRLTTPERIDRMRALRSARQAQTDQRMDATKIFYSTLDAQQRQVFDRAGMRMLRGGHGKHGGQHGWREHQHRG